MGTEPSTPTLPRVPAFEAFFATLTLVPKPPGDGWSEFDVVPFRREAMGARIVESPAVRAWYRPGGALEATAVIDRLRKLMRAIGHCDSRDIAAALLGLTCVTDREGRNPLDHVNHLLAALGPAETEEHLVSPLPTFPGARGYSVGEFAIARADPEKLRYRCERVGCNFFQLNPDALRDGETISRRNHPVRALEVSKAPRAQNVPTSLFRTILDYYFTGTTEVLRQRFLNDFREAQEVLVAEGAPYNDTTEPMIWGGATFISIFEYPGQRGGYFCPVAQHLTVDFAKADQRIPEVAARLKETFAFDGTLRGELGATLRSFCRFVTRATCHRSQGNIDEAFLHFVIALDLVFGERAALNDSVTSRTAAIAGPGLGLSYSDAQKLVDDLYDLRSRYVHSGAPIAETELDRVERVTREVLHALLRVHGRPSSADHGARDAWLGRVQRLVHIHRAEKPPTDEDLSDAGLRD